jgi:hypothetical protein
MPADLKLAAQVASIASAMFNAIRFSESLAHWLHKPTDRAKIDKQAKLLASTYSNAELKALRDRIQGCEDRFIREGNGLARKRCMCSVLQDAKDGNGGNAPLPDWEEMYGALGCPV